MKEYFEKSLQKIKSLRKIINEKEWNALAMKEGYLSSESIQYMSGKSIRRLCKIAIKGKL